MLFYLVPNLFYYDLSNLETHKTRMNASLTSSTPSRLIGREKGPMPSMTLMVRQPHHRFWHLKMAKSMMLRMMMTNPTVHLRIRLLWQQILTQNLPRPDLQLLPLRPQHRRRHSAVVAMAERRSWPGWRRSSNPVEQAAVNLG